MWFNYFNKEKPRKICCGNLYHRKKGNKSTKEYPKFGHISPKIINKHLWKTQISGHKTLKFVENFIFYIIKKCSFQKKLLITELLKRVTIFLNLLYIQIITNNI